MNKLVVLAKNQNTYFIKRLMEEVGEGVACFNPWQDFILPEAPVYLSRCTGVYGNDLDLMFLKTLPAGKIINPLGTLQRFRSKSSQYTWMEERNLPCLPWIPLPGMDLIQVERFFRLYPRSVVKPLIGQGGWGVEELNWERFRSWWKKRKGNDEQYLLQPLVQDARELRYFFIKDNFSLVLERKALSGISANFQKQGSAEVSTLPAEFQTTIETLIKESGAIYGAIDLFIEDGRLQILELNSVPGIEQLEKVSGINIMQSLCQVFLSDFLK